MSEKCASLSGEPKARSRGPDPKISSQRMRGGRRDRGEEVSERCRKAPGRGRGVSQLVAESAARAAHEMAGMPRAYLPLDSLYGNELVSFSAQEMAGMPRAYLPPDSLYGNELVSLAENETNSVGSLPRAKLT